MRSQTSQCLQNDHQNAKYQQDTATLENTWDALGIATCVRRKGIIDPVHEQDARVQG